MNLRENWRFFLILFGLLLGVTGCTQVDAGNLGVVTKWGEIQDVALQEGIHFRTPVKTQIINISTRVHKMEASATASSKDLQVVSTKIALNYRLDASQIVEIFRNIGTRVAVENTIVDPALQESLKKATAQYTAEELITKRQEVKETLAESIRLTLAKSDILVTELSITDFQFDAQYQQAVEAKQVAEQRALTAKNDLARIRVEAEQAEAKARGTANAMLATAEAEAKAQELLRKTISPEIVYLRAVEKWDGRQPTVLGEGGAILDLGAIKKAAGR
ncbi:MAG: prohibitin family protein [Deltaproteobacteria bacterium]|jgi:regulator of protease activity HflC (stomatin/prohibitin superfamily)|nr:prohibitin family protein [Deltaproteobacteria bacterium]